jgi:hypothetical protein
MHPVILTLQVPKGGRGIPVATSGNANLLAYFREVVLMEAERNVDHAEDELEALLARLELERLQRALAVLIPDVEQIHWEARGDE